MTATAILAYLHRQGVELWTENGRLRYSAPKGVLTPALRSQLVEHKEEIIHLLKTLKSSSETPLPLLPAARDGELPLSFTQQRLWFLDQLEPNSPFYTISTSIHLTGLLNVAALAESINEIVRRHEALRTNFIQVNGRPIQVIAPDLTLSIPVIDLELLSPIQQRTEVERLAREEVARPFNLSSEPLIRVRLLRLSSSEHILFLSLHHIVCDGWSLGVLIRELSSLYRAFLAGRPSMLSELALQFADFALWQGKWLQGAILEQQLHYWKQQLTGAPTILDLPTDYPRPAIQTFQGAQYLFELPRSLSQDLHALSRHENATLFMTLFAAFATLLWRYSNQEDIVIGTPVANRTRAEIEGLIGSFINTLMLRARLSGDLDFRTLLKRVRAFCLEAYAHQELPFEKLVEELAPKRDLSHAPLFQVMFALQNAPTAPLELPGLTLTLREVIDTGTSRMDLMLAMVETPGGLKGLFEYNTSLFTESTIRRMVEHWQHLLSGIVETPHLPLSKLPLLSAKERQQLLLDWSFGSAAFPQIPCVHQFFEEQVRQTPAAIALSYEDQQLSYQELDRRANQLAHYLQRQGIGPEVLVGLYLERSLEMVVGLLAILKAGGAYLPLDPGYPEPRLAFMMNDAQVSIILTQHILAQQLSLPEISIICLDTDWELVERELTTSPSTQVTPENMSCVIYTSGSTGRPKGVMIPHRAISNRLQWGAQDIQLCPTDRLLQVTALSFDVALWELFGLWLKGAHLVLPPAGITREPERLIALLIEEQITLIHFVTSVLQLLVEAPGLEQCTDLRCVFYGGEAASGEMAQRFFARLNAQLHNFYGPTEATVNVTRWKCEQEQPGQPIPIGQPIAGAQVYLLDADLQPAPIGVTGELYLGGVGLARGYLQRPELTAESFIPHPFSNEAGARLYRTGDLARYLPDGRLEFIGRRDAQIKWRGYRIELGEVETGLREYPLLRDAIAMLREDRPGDKRLVAYILPQEQQQLNIEELRRWMTSRFPDYMIPSSFVVLDSLPLGPNDKVDRRALPAPTSDRPELAVTYSAPRSPVEEVLTGIWSQILGIQQVGVHDDFFALGGHSLLATQVIARIRDALQIETPLRALFETPTIAGLARHITDMQRRDLKVPAIKPRSDSKNQPLSFAQQRLWFLDQLEPDTSTYTIPTAIRLHGTLNVTALEQSLNEIVRRHEVLRTIFEAPAGQPAQIILPGLKIPLPVINLSSIASDQQEAEAHRLIREEASSPFALNRGPLLRASLLRLSPIEHILLLNIHHIAFDGWSLGIVVDELSTLYAAFVAGQTSPLPELSLQYADFALWQRTWLQGEMLQQQLDYWKRRLAGAPTVLELPGDRTRPSIQSYQGSLSLFEIPSDISRELAAISQRAGATMFMTLLAAFATLLLRYTGQEDMLIGTPIANRQHTQLEGIIGFFVNTLVLRTDLAGNPSFLELLQRVRQVALEGYAHQDLPFEKLVDELAPERDLSHSPLFQVMFVLQNTASAILDLPGLKLEPVEIDNATAKFDLTLSIHESFVGKDSPMSFMNAPLRGILEYNTDLFDALTIERMATHWLHLLAGIVANPEQRLTSLPLLGETEREQMLVAWNSTQRDYPTDVCLHHIFEAQVTQRPDAIAVAFEDEQLTYDELNRRANRVAHHLRAYGVGPDTLVALLDERGCNFLTAILAIFKAGGAYLPLDPLYPPARLRQIVENSNCSLLLVADTLFDTLSQLSDGKRQKIMRLEECLQRGLSEANLPTWQTSHHLAYVIYTSGSTGTPKGAMIEQRNMMNHLFTKIADLDLTSADIIAQTASQCFDISVWQFLTALMVGGRIQIYPDEVTHDFTRLLPQIQSHRATFLEVVPSFLRAMIEAIEDESISRGYLEGLRWLIPTGEALPPELCRQWLKIYPSIPLLNAYGPAECSDDVTLFPIYEPLPSTAIHTPIGRPVHNMQVYILDKKMQPIPIGVSGEVYIGGIGVGRGYREDAQLTAGAFVPDPFSGKPGTRLYRTGDLARYLPDGTIEFSGRIDYQVKVRGYRIELGEIEAVLGQHPAVREAVIWVHQELSGGKRLVAYIVLQTNLSSTDILLQYLQERLPGYMVPSAFVVLDALPLSPNGKIDYHALPAPDSLTSEHAKIFVKPRTYAEETLASIWADLLRVKRVSINDNFFELGGDSILSIQVIARARQKGVHLTPRQLFQYQTIAALATVIDTTPIIQAEQTIISGTVPLTPIQRWFFEQQYTDLHHYNQTMLLKTVPDLDVSHLEQALQHLQFHHDALRMRFTYEATSWHQENADATAIEPLWRVDLTTPLSSEQSLAIERIATDLQASLKLREGQLLRIAFFDRGPQQSGYLLIVVHHLIIDIVSWRVILTDIQTAYQQLERNEIVLLPPKTTSFQQWSRYLHTYAHSPALQAERDYWLAEPRSQILPLPLDYPEGDNIQGSICRLTVTLSSRETLALLQKVPAVYHTQINDLLLAALALACSEWTGSPLLLLDIEGHGREDIVEGVDLSRTVGWFTALYPLLLNLEGVDGPGETIKSIKEQLRRIPNRGIGYGVLRYLSEDSEIVECLSALPQPEISFNYRGQVEQTTPEGSFFVPTEEASGPTISPRVRRSYLLEINGHVLGNQLYMEWTYSEQMHHRATVERLANSFLEKLQMLIAHCQSPNAGGYTPSDFPQARLNQKALDKLLAKMSQANRRQSQ